MQLLICTDGSPQADNAIELGGAIAESCDAEVTILGIAEKTADEPEIQQALERGSDIVRRRGKEPDLMAITGDPVEEIVGVTTRSPYDLVVVGAVRKGPRGAFLMSAKAYKIIKAVTPPVLVVIGERRQIRKILVCSGGERYIDKAVEFTGRVARATGASVTLLHVMPEPPEDYRDLVRMEEDVNILLHSNLGLGKNLSRERELLDRLGVTSHVRLRHGLVLSEVFKEIRRGDYDLVVTGSTPSGGTLRTYIMGNITREIVNRADCPVLVVRSDEEPTSFAQSLKGLFSSTFGSSKENR